MIYGLYLSASGVLTNSYRQDVIANNLANAETVGFKRDLALFRERLTQAQTDPTSADWSNDQLEALGGGLFASPTAVDSRQGDLEQTGNALDVGVEGTGFFMVDDAGEQKLTRNGQFMIDREGYLILANGSGEKVLDANRQPIRLDGSLAGLTHVAKDGQITQDRVPAGRIGLFHVADESRLTKQGGMLLNHPEAATLPASTTALRSGFIERANVDPTTELAALMDAQRQLEANANMIRYQDATLGKLVNEVGKIS
jgi:flagellar basal body rod protein FlgG